jgi:hypothetical protein
MGRERAFLAVALAAATGLSLESPVVAQPTGSACAEANSAMKTLIESGRWRAARESGTICTSQNCPKAIRDQCSERLSTLERVAPTLVFVVTDSSGNDLAAVRVTMDGKPLVERVDGPAVSVDLGQHTFGFEASGFLGATKTLVVREAEKDRRVEVRLESTGASSAPTDVPPPAASISPPAPAAALAAATESSPSTSAASIVAQPAGSTSPLTHSQWPAYAAFGIGGAGFAVGIIYGLLAVDTKHKLDVSCAVRNACPGPDQPAIDALNRQATVSTVGFGVGIAGAAAGAVLYWLARRAESSPTTAVVHPWFGVGSVGLVGELP